MILTCEECQTRYLVPGHVIGPEGRRVRCTNCGYEWFVEPEDEEDYAEAEDVEPIPESVKPMPEGSELPALTTFVPEAARHPGSVAGYAGALAVFVLLLGLLVVLHNPLVRVWPASASIYGLLGISSPVMGEGLIFDNVTAVIVPTADGMNMLQLEGTIMNLQTEPIEVPEIQASLLREDGEAVDRWLVDPENDVVEPHQQTIFSSTYPEVPADVREVNVRLLAGKAEPVEEVSKNTGSVEDGQHEAAAGQDAGHENGHDAPSH